MIPSRDTRLLTESCVASILSSGATNLEIILVDDAGSDGTAQGIRERFPEVQVLVNLEQEGFSRSVNRGASRARGQILLVLNSDTEVDPQVWSLIVDTFHRCRGLGIAGARLRYPDGTPQWSGGPEPTLLWLFALASGLGSWVGRIPGARRIRRVRGAGGGTVDWVTGAAMAVRREAWEEVGPFDEGYRLYCQDLDLCTRARDAGWDIAILHDFTVLHHHGATIGRETRATDNHRPDLLWLDLLRWVEKHRGASRARQAGLVLRAGGSSRLLARAICGAFLTGDARLGWTQESRAYRKALARLSEGVSCTSRPI